MDIKTLGAATVIGLLAGLLGAKLMAVPAPLAAPADTGALDRLNSTVAAMDSRLARLLARLSAVENRPVARAAAAAPPAAAGPTVSPLPARPVASAPLDRAAEAKPATAAKPEVPAAEVEDRMPDPPTDVPIPGAAALDPITPSSAPPPEPWRIVGSRHAWVDAHELVDELPQRARGLSAAIGKRTGLDSAQQQRLSVAIDEVASDAARQLKGYLAGEMPLSALRVRYTTLKTRFLSGLTDALSAEQRRAADGLVQRAFEEYAEWARPLLEGRK
ncbi:MAG: hypothetical protein ACI9WU_000497 [Myxococcota bacterium]|jgi:hypothetical protein